MEGDAPPGAEPSSGAEVAYRVGEDVVAAIAHLAASEVGGVTALGGGAVLDLGEVFAKRTAARGVRVELGTREVALDLYLHVAFGARIPAVAHRVQERVKEAVEGMTGLRVVQVNVHVQGVDAAPGGGPDARRGGPEDRPSADRPQSLPLPRDEGAGPAPVAPTGGG